MLKKTAVDAMMSYRHRLKNHEHHTPMILQGAIEMRQVVQGLRDKGAIGTELKDLAKASEIAPALGTARDAIAGIAEGEEVLKKRPLDPAAPMVALAERHGDIRKEMADRTKKRLGSPVGKASHLSHRAGLDRFP